MTTTTHEPGTSKPAFSRHAVWWLILFVVVMLIVVISMWFRSPVRAGDLTFKPTSLQLDLNTVDAVALSALPGLGPQLAERIIEHRVTHGPFRTLDDLQQVHGIGERTLHRLEPYLTVSSQPR